MPGTQRCRTAVAAALALTLAATLAGCSDEEKPRSLPSLTPGSPSPTPSITDTRGMTDKQQVKAIYKEFDARVQAGQDMPEAERRKYFAQWTIDPALSQFVDGYQAMLDRNERLFGKAVPHIFSVTIEGKTAKIDDCSDVSKVIRKDTKTGKVVSKRVKTSWVVMTLKKTSTGWRIAESTARSESCDKHL